MSRTRTYFRKAQRPRPVKKCKVTAQAREHEKSAGLGALTKYLIDNASSGLSRKELIEQFHEFDCDGELEEVFDGHLARCTGCDYWEVVNGKAKA